jgi:DNA-directed RNA polymerase subunit RPC12/RpoP
LKRIHRTFAERLAYLAIYECRDCQEINTVPRRFRLHFGAYCRCPQCGTFRVVRLKKRDKIDPMDGGFLHLLERMAGGHIYHCRYCRLQFYDRRGLAPESDARSSAGASPREEGIVQ